MLPEDKTILQIIVTKEEKKKLERLADSDERSLSKFCSLILKSVIKKSK